MIDLVNVSNKPVIIEINGVLAGSVASDAKRNFEVELGEKTVITLRHDKISYKKGSKAHMHIETTYELSEIDQRTPLVIKYDQMHIDMGIYYHCFFLSQKTFPLTIIHIIETNNSNSINTKDALPTPK